MKNNFDFLTFLINYVIITEICFKGEVKMESLTHKIRFLYSQMGSAEKRIADYLLNDPTDVINISISELSERCNCGKATAVRFSRRLGCDGFQALKIALASEFSVASTLNSEIEKGDSCLDIFRKRINDISVSLWATETVLNNKSLERAANLIANSKRIVIYGLGNSAAIAQDAAHKFLRLGLFATACSDNHMQAIISSHLEKGCVAIGISHSGVSKDIVDSLHLARQKGAVTICVTNYEISPIVKEADIPLFTKSDETTHSLLAMSSRIAQLAIFDTIYTYIVLNSKNSSINEIYNTENSLKSKKLN